MIDGIPTCEVCGIEGADEYYIAVLDPDAQRDGGPPHQTTRAFLCDAHAQEAQNDDLTVHMGRA